MLIDKKNILFVEETPLHLKFKEVYGGSTVMEKEIFEGDAFEFFYGPSLVVISKNKATVGFKVFKLSPKRWKVEKVAEFTENYACASFFYPNLVLVVDDQLVVLDVKNAQVRKSHQVENVKKILAYDNIFALIQPNKTHLFYVLKNKLKKMDVVLPVNKQVVFKKRFFVVDEKFVTFHSKHKKIFSFKSKINFFHVEKLKNIFKLVVLEENNQFTYIEMKQTRKGVVSKSLNAKVEEDVKGIWMKGNIFKLIKQNNTIKEFSFHELGVEEAKESIQIKLASEEELEEKVGTRAREEQLFQNKIINVEPEDEESTKDDFFLDSLKSGDFHRVASLTTTEKIKEINNTDKVLLLEELLKFDDWKALSRADAYGFINFILSREILRHFSDAEKEKLKEVKSLVIRFREELVLRLNRKRKVERLQDVIEYVMCQDVQPYKPVPFVEYFE
eukprot:snap_masked-scaffold_26-processed-gene-0.16-mRNA-1 protein AED:1.00 eAED:1.00 QI:0/-1/0/0/-1/1/1/0/444